MPENLPVDPLSAAPPGHPGPGEENREPGARQIMRRQAGDNRYLHKDFHGALSAGIDYLESHFGQQAVRDYLGQFAKAFYAPLTEDIRRRGLVALQEHLSAIYELEGASPRFQSTFDELLVEVDACPAVAHMRQHGYSVAKLFVETERTVNQAICEGTPFAARTCPLRPRIGRQPPTLFPEAGMISCTHFIPAYSELFKFLENRGGKQAVDDFWNYLSDRFLGNLRDLVLEHGIRGCWLYWSHTPERRGRRLHHGVGRTGRRIPHRHAPLPLDGHAPGTEAHRALSRLLPALRRALPPRARTVGLRVPDRSVPVPPSPLQRGGEEADGKRRRLISVETKRHFGRLPRGYGASVGPIPDDSVKGDSCRTGQTR